MEFLADARAIIISELPSTEERAVTSAFHHEEVFFKLVDCTGPLHVSCLAQRALAAESSAAHRPHLLSIAIRNVSVVT